MSRRRLAVALVTVGVLGGFAAPAFARGGESVSSDAKVEPDAAEAVVIVGQRDQVMHRLPKPPAKTGSGHPWTCGFYLILSDVPEGFTPGLGFQNMQRATPTEDGTYYFICTDDVTGDRVVERSVTYHEGNPSALLGESGPPAVNVQAAAIRIEALKPIIRTSPPATGRQIVNVKTWFWIDSWDELDAEGQADGYTIRLHARPAELVIDPGDGTGEIHCTRQTAIPWAKGGPADTRCGHAYFKKSADQPDKAFHVTARMRYQNVTWSVDGPTGPAAGEPLPEITSGDADLRLVVHEVQAVGR
jgi:hypothetical protein